MRSADGWQHGFFPVAVYRSRWCFGPRSTGGMATWVLEENGVGDRLCTAQKYFLFLGWSKLAQMEGLEAWQGSQRLPWAREGWSSADGVGHVIIAHFALNFLTWKVVGNGYPSCWEMAKESGCLIHFRLPWMLQVGYVSKKLGWWISTKHCYLRLLSE